MKTNWKNFEIESEHKGEKASNWNKHNKHCHHIITVKNTDDGTSMQFEYWAPLAKPEITEEKELLSAVDCIFNDASYGHYTFEAFCRELGYDIPDGTYDNWRACAMALSSVNDVFGENWTDVADELREEVN